jgi:ubiquinone/menaquinone biosynthesis C-methylase UbiE
VSDQTAEHYERLADRYDANWVYSPEFVSWMSARIVDRLTPHPGECVLDLGCGTGLYARCLAEQAGRVVCVDPSAEMLEQLPAGEPFIAVQGAVEELTAGAVPLPHERFDAVLAKEVLHHVARSEQPDVLRGLAGLLVR